MNSTKYFWRAIAIAILVLLPVVLAADSAGGSVTGAASGSLAPGAMLGGIPLDGFDLGTGVLVDSDGTAEGTFHAVLSGTVLGQPRSLTLEGKITQGTVAGDGTATVSGRATLDLGDGAPPVPVTWLSVNVSGNGLVVGVDTATLTGTVSKGTVAVE
jgi:hypothetical protein